MRRLAQLFVFSLLVFLLLPETFAHAQASDSVIDVLEVDTSTYPSVSLTLTSKGDASIAEMPLRILLDGLEQPVIQDHNETAAIQVALMLDPRDMDAVGIEEQSHYAAVMAALLSATENGLFIEKQDWLYAATADSGGNLNKIQDWTQQPDRLIDSLLSESDALTTSEPQSTSDALMYALDEFTYVDGYADHARSLIYFAVGAEQNRFTEDAVTKLAEQAGDAGIQLHTVQFVTQAQPAAPDASLQSLAAQSSGQFLMVESFTVLKELLHATFAARERRIIDFIIPSQTQSSIAVQVDLADGTTVEESINLYPTSTGELKAEVVTTLNEGSHGSSETVGAASAQNGSTSAEEDVPVEIADVTVESPTQGRRPPLATAQSLASDTSEEPLFSLQNLFVAAIPLMLILMAFLGVHQIKERRQQKYQFQVSEESAVDIGFDIEQSLYAPTEPDAMPPDFLDAGLNDRLIRYERLAFSTDDIAPRNAEQGNRLMDGTPTEVAYLRGFGLEGKDNNATYLLPPALQRPKLGHLLCMSQELGLPQRLPIYQLTSWPDEIRRLYIGRHSQHNTLVINNEYVSREHAMLIQKGAQLYIYDNNSSTGTFLNGKRLAAGEELLLRDRDVISFGQVVYEFRQFRASASPLALTDAQQDKTTTKYPLQDSR